MNTQFAAGFYYGMNNREKDFRDYLVGCMVDNSDLSALLTEAFTDYNVGDNQSGTGIMQLTEPYWKTAMANCPESNPWFDDFFSSSNALFARNDYQTIVDNNYAANKDFVDTDWGFCLQSWNWGIYFDAGMFYGEIWARLSVVPAQ